MQEALAKGLTTRIYLRHALRTLAPHNHSIPPLLTMELDIPTASLIGICLLVLVFIWVRFRSNPPVARAIRRTYTATATYIAETIVQPSQATHLVFPAPSLHSGMWLVVTDSRLPAQV